MFKRIKVRKFLEETCGAKVEWVCGNVIKVDGRAVWLDDSKFVLGNDWHFYGTKRSILSALNNAGFAYKPQMRLSYLD